MFIRMHNVGVRHLHRDLPLRWLVQPLKPAFEEIHLVAIAELYANDPVPVLPVLCHKEVAHGAADRGPQPFKSSFDIYRFARILFEQIVEESHRIKINSRTKRGKTVCLIISRAILTSLARLPGRTCGASICTRLFRK